MNAVKMPTLGHRASLLLSEVAKGDKSSVHFLNSTNESNASDPFTATDELEWKGARRYRHRLSSRANIQSAMPDLFHAEPARRIQASGIIAVVVLRDLDRAVPLAHALIAGGIDVIELTLRTPAALPAIARLKRDVPELMVGAGTILSASDLEAARQAGADFGVSPGVNRSVLEAAARTGFSFAPGVATPSDIEAALEHGCRLLKFFPAEQIGGLRYFNAVTGPYEHLGLRYIPLGGLNEELIPAYLQRPSVAAIGGSWMAAGELIASGNWAKITALARQASELARHPRKAT
jgi:2-dehydro-3-deoxyphosphogluconate aldolase/(4S)-4-hydroxy-2-oxoglutarate aldolase